MDFQTLKSSVESALGRTDVPDYVYTLMTSDINRDIRIVEMESLSTMSVSSETTTLPADFLQVVSMYVDATPRTPMVPLTRQAQATRHDESNKPYYYAISGPSADDPDPTTSTLQVMPAPDSTYSVVMRYIASVAAFSANTDTNNVISLHPGLFLYAALHHAAIWAQDAELAAGYGAAYVNLKSMIQDADRKKRNSGPMTQRTAVQL